MFIGSTMAYGSQDNFEKFNRKKGGKKNKIRRDDKPWQRKDRPKNK